MAIDRRVSRKARGVDLARRAVVWRHDRDPALRDRSSALDSLRVAAMIGVVVLHAAFSYTRVPVPHLPWVVKEPAQGLAYDVAFWWLLGVSMPIFFALGGFSAEAIMASRGLTRYVEDRVRRVVLPFLGALPFILVPTYCIWFVGWLVTDRCAPHHFWFLSFDDEELSANSFGPAHLWFLEYLSLYLLAFGLVRRFGPGRVTPPLSRLFAWWTPLALAAPTTAVLWLSHGVESADAILTMRNSFIPDPWRLLHHGLFFAFGIHLRRAWADRAQVIRGWKGWAVVSIAAFVARAWLLERDLVAPLDGGWLVLNEAAAAVFGWTGLYAAIGLALRHGDRASPAIRVWADAGFWLYLVHFPIVGLVQADLYGVESVPVFAKFLVVLATTFALGTLSYIALVRDKRIGRLLQGGKRHEAPTAAPNVAVGATSAR